jgi:amino acid transporter
LFLYPAILLFLTGLFTFLQKLLSSYSSLYTVDMVFFFLAYLLGIIALLVVIFISWRWFKLFRRFV